MGCWIAFLGEPEISLSEFSNSTIIHEVKTKKTSQPWRRFGYSVLISIDFDDFTSQWLTLSFCFNWEDTYVFQTLEADVFHQLSKHKKYSAACHIFNSLLGEWIFWWNTVTRCLIYYYFKNIKSHALLVCYL